MPTTIDKRSRYNNQISHNTNKKKGKNLDILLWEHSLTVMYYFDEKNKLIKQMNNISIFSKKKCRSQKWNFIPFLSKVEYLFNLFLSVCLNSKQCDAFHLRQSCFIFLLKINILLMKWQLELQLKNINIKLLQPSIHVYYSLQRHFFSYWW
jgi:hypothetical protein